MNSTAQPIDVTKIMGMLPHRYPFLLVDRVLEYESGVGIKALKNVTMNEPFFQGHFPGLPIMPGVLILEALAQTGGLLVSLSSTESLVDKLFLFAGMERVRFRKPVVPGDQVLLRCFDVRRRFQLWKMSGEALVDGNIVAEAVLTAAITDREGI